MKKLDDKTLLVLSLYYTNKEGDIVYSSFVEEQVKQLKKHFNKIIVIAPIQYFPKKLSKLSFIPQLYKDLAKLKNYSYDNVEVYFPTYYTLPIEFFRRRNAKYAYSATDRCIKNNKISFDIIHAHFTWPIGDVGTKLKAKYEKKLIITAHGFDIYDLPFRNYYWKNKIKSVLKKSDKVITVSKSNMKCIKKLGQQRKASVIPNGFDSEKFFPMKKNKVRKKLNVPNDKKILLHVGNLKPVKNHITLVRAINELIKVRKDILLYLVGSGHYKNRIQDEIKDLNLNKYIKLLGSKPHKEIPFWMNAADLFVFPSLAEGNPTVMFENLACGNPIIAADAGGIKEIINSKKYGFIINDRKNPKELSKLIQLALNKEWDSKEIVNYSKEFTWKKVVFKVLEVYKNECKT